MSTRNFAIYMLSATATWHSLKIALLWLIRQCNPIASFCVRRDVFIVNFLLLLLHFFDLRSARWMNLHVKVVRYVKNICKLILKISTLSTHSDNYSPGISCRNVCLFVCLFFVFLPFSILEYSRVVSKSPVTLQPHECKLLSLLGSVNGKQIRCDCFGSEK